MQPFRKDARKSRSNSVDIVNKNFIRSFVQKGQNGALEHLCKNKVPVCIYLSTGMMLDCVITSYDQYTINLIDNKNVSQMIYKDKITTIQLKRGNVPRLNTDNV